MLLERGRTEPDESRTANEVSEHVSARFKSLPARFYGNSHDDEHLVCSLLARCCARRRRT
ncbi:hypothetical protein HSB1_37690 [Halogranum salarium B-1]|uniref:Uncharacterized protein n=1 Tax=Halogranum salarium B-1 TaxID=1210908 RepID=J3EV15_9EURY|nr:hypothetical protein HSB1_37690 [Halogranum salarium B-1]